MACSPECQHAWRAQQRAASVRRYRTSRLGRKTTRKRVERWRAKQRSIVTHTAAQEVGPRAIVASHDDAVIATKAALASRAKDTSHGEDPPQTAGVAVDARSNEVDVVDGKRRGPSADRGDLRCARCRRPGVETPEEDGGVSGSVPYARRRRSRRWAMTATSTAAEGPKPLPLGSLGTTFGRARFPQPTRVDRMKQSLSTHGQLTPVVAVTRPEGLELIDGFKRRAAAALLGWTTLTVTVRAFDATAQWAAMLLLNRGSASMTAFEEALVLREILRTGSTQVEIAALCTRHKSWVSRRLGLIERLHPELLEAMKLGLLHPGVARRLLSLPPGNQLELAAVAQTARLGPHDTELLVSLWRRAKEPARRTLIAQPKVALSEHRPPPPRSTTSPLLSQDGRLLSKSLHRLEAATAETSRRLRPPPAAQDMAILDKDVRRAQRAASRLATELGSARSATAASGSDESDETG
jgi:ParB/RepB/Spo0J family partition protein